MQTIRRDYKGHDIRVTRFFDGLKNALFIGGMFTGEAGFSSFEAALAYGERLIDEGSPVVVRVANPSTGRES